jgi:hypothetical protein
VLLAAGTSARADVPVTRVLLLPLGSPQQELAGLADVGTTLLLGALRTRPALDVTAPSEVAALRGLQTTQERAGADVPPQALVAAADLKLDELVSAELVETGGARLVLRRVRVSDASVVRSVEQSLGPRPDEGLTRAIGLAVERLYPLADFGGPGPRPTRPMWLGLGAVGSVAAAGICLGGVVLAAGMAALLTGLLPVAGTPAFPWPAAAAVSVGLGAGLVLGLLGLTGVGTGLVAALVGG